MTTRLRHRKIKLLTDLFQVTYKFDIPAMWLLIHAYIARIHREYKNPAHATLHHVRTIRTMRGIQRYEEPPELLQEAVSAIFSITQTTREKSKGVFYNTPAGYRFGATVILHGMTLAGTLTVTANSRAVLFADLGLLLDHLASLEACLDPLEG